MRTFNNGNFVVKKYIIAKNMAIIDYLTPKFFLTNIISLKYEREKDGRGVR